MSEDLEALACQPCPVESQGFNPNTQLPYGCTTQPIQQAMNDFVEFLGFINQQLHVKGLERFESMLMPANFSTQDDWAFSGRSATSRRTITASVTRLKG
jgi:hypothetical protein